MLEDYNFINHGIESPIRPDGAEAYIQWKSTDAFFEFTCECGKQGSFDGYFGQVVKCGGCNQEWEMPSHLYPRKRCEKTYPGHEAKNLQYDEES